MAAVVAVGALALDVAAAEAVAGVMAVTATVAVAVAAAVNVAVAAAVDVDVDDAMAFAAVFSQFIYSIYNILFTIRKLFHLKRIFIEHTKVFTASPT